MNTTTMKAMALGRPSGPIGFFTGRSAFDWLFAALVLAGGAYAFARYAGAMDYYEKLILVSTLPVAILLGWFWGSLRVLMLGVAAASLLAISLYNRQMDGFGADLAQADKVFMLKYFLSSQSAIMWMSVLFFMSTTFYWIGFAAKTEHNRRSRTPFLPGVCGPGRASWGGESCVTSTRRASQTNRPTRRQCPDHRF